MPEVSAWDLDALRRRAEALAASRRERPTTAHLLAAMELSEPRGAALLRQRSLTCESLLRGARASSDDQRDPLGEALRRSRAVAARMRAPEPSSLHLLVALLSQQRSAAYRALDMSGVDIGRLRVDALNLALEELGRQPVETPREQARSRLTKGAPRRAVSVPVMPMAPRDLNHRLQATPTVESTTWEQPRPATARREGAGASGEQPSSFEDHKAKPGFKGRQTRFKLDAKRFPLLTALTHNLTLAAQRNELPIVVRRELEIQQLLDVLARRTGNNPCLVGPAGVGKTSVVLGLCQHIVNDVAPGSVDDRLVLELELSKLLADTGVRGALASRLGALAKEVETVGRPIVLVCERLHEWFGTDASDELSGELNRLLRTGALCCIATDTREGFQKLLESDATLSSLLNPVEVEEPIREEAFLMLSALAPSLGAHHGLGFSEEILALVVAWSSRYLPSRALPAKATALLDLAGARARRRGLLSLSVELLAEVVAEQVNVPAARLLEADGERLLHLEKRCSERVVGHESQIARMARIIRRNAAGLNGRRPIRVFLLLGPTGVGKTETAKALAEALFDREDALTRLDMSEYSESHAVARLIGAPPGYIGHDSGGQLTEAVRRAPYQVLLLDEIEKAHSDVLQAFLGVFDEGRLTDGRGRLVDFTNTVIILTSNIGSREASPAGAQRLGFGTGATSSERDALDLERRVANEARKVLAPEWYNRIDDVLFYAPLSREQARQIAGLLFQQLTTTLEEKQVALTVDPDVIEHLLAEGGFVPELGARPIKRVMARLIESEIAEQLLSGTITAGSTVKLRMRGEVLEFEVKPTSSGSDRVSLAS